MLLIYVIYLLMKSPIFAAGTNGEKPTLLRNSFFIIRFDFSCVDPIGTVASMLIQEKISYKKAYYNLVTKENLEGIKIIINNHGYYDPTSIKKIQYRKLKSLPYFFLTFDSPEYTNGHYAMLDGIYLNVNSIIPRWIGKFYLSIVIIRKPGNKKIKPFIAPDQDVAHELNHLNFLIE